MTAIVKDYVIKPEMKIKIPMGIAKFLSMVREGTVVGAGVLLTTLPKTRSSEELADFASLLITISSNWYRKEMTKLGIVFHKGRYGANDWKTFTVPVELMVEYTG